MIIDRLMKRLMCDHKYYLAKNYKYYLFTKRYWRCDKCGSIKTEISKND